MNPEKLGLTVVMAVTLLAPAGAQAATLSAYDTALQGGAKRGYSGEQRSCYARVFARHASPTPEGRWIAKIVPSYTTELWNECRLALPASSGQKPTAYQTGLKIAAERGFSGERRECVARVFTRYATLNAQGRWSALLVPSFQAELWSECRANQ